MTDDTDDDTDEMTEKAMTLVRGAAHESRVSWLPESQKLQDAIGDALHAYWDYLEQQGVITDGRELLIAKCNGGIGWDIEMRNGALDVLYPDEDNLLGSVEKWGRCEEWPRKVWTREELERRIKEIDGEHDDGEKV